jgi:hypothetical protein
MDKQHLKDLGIFGIGYFTGIGVLSLILLILELI